jgi:hypothetical protein
VATLQNERPFIETLAYSIQAAYNDPNIKTGSEVVEQVKDKYQSADINILWAMFAAIDAYVDANIEANGSECGISIKLKMSEVPRWKPKINLDL